MCKTHAHLAVSMFRGFKKVFHIRTPSIEKLLIASVCNFKLSYKIILFLLLLSPNPEGVGGGGYSRCAALLILGRKQQTPIICINKNNQRKFQKFAFIYEPILQNYNIHVSPHYVLFVLAKCVSMYHTLS